MYFPLIDSEGSPYPPPIQRYVRGRENSTNADALQPMLAPIRNNMEQIDEDPFEQQPRRLQLPPPPAMQPDPNAVNVNANIVQIPRSMINVARRQQELINADNLVSQDSNGSSGTGHEDSGPENRVDRHADEQPGPSSSSVPRMMSPEAGPSTSTNNDNRIGSNEGGGSTEKPVAPYKLCILKDDVCVKEVQEALKNIATRTKVESIQYNKESGIPDRRRTEHDYARSKSRNKNHSTAERLNTSGRNGATGNANATRIRREDRERTTHDRDNRAYRPNNNEQPRRRYLMRDDDDEEDNANAEDQDEDELDTSDCSLDESDFSSSVCSLNMKINL